MELKSIRRPKIFIPETWDNKKEKPENQIKVHIESFPSGAQVGLYRTFRMKNGLTEVVYDNVSMMINHVGNLDNLKIGGELINDAVKLCDFPDSRLYDLIIDIRNYLLKESEDLPEGESKASAPSSD